MLGIYVYYVFNKGLTQIEGKGALLVQVTVSRQDYRIYVCYMCIIKTNQIKFQT